jgi:dTDP-4-amino-4,6-dideoxygalactose transaminase
VITSAFTFLASASCALHQNAIPVFVDIDHAHTTWIGGSKRRSTGEPRSSSPCTFRVCQPTWTPIMEIARKHNLYVVEDACQATAPHTRAGKSAPSATSGPYE